MAGLVVTPLGTDGSLDVYTSVGADLVVDIVGYVTDTTAADSSAGLFVPVVPQRQLDTRTDRHTPVAPGTTFTTTISTLPSDADAAAFVGNLTAVEATEGAWIQVGPAPLAVGASSALNTSYARHTVANAVVAAMNRRPSTSIRRGRRTCCSTSSATSPRRPRPTDPPTRRADHDPHTRPTGPAHRRPDRPRHARHPCDRRLDAAGRVRPRRLRRQRLDRRRP